MIGCIIVLKHDTIQVGQRWPIIPGGRGDRVVLRRTRYSLVLMVTLSIDFNSWHTLQYFQNIERNGCSLHNRRAGNTMSTTKEQKIQNIVELLNKCHDIPLLDLIEKLLRKSV